jgi:hypothetical protein
MRRLTPTDSQRGGGLVAGGKGRDSNPVEIVDRGTLICGAVGQLREVDPEALTLLELSQGLPKSHLSGDPDKQALQFEHSTQRGVAT